MQAIYDKSRPLKKLSVWYRIIIMLLSISYATNAQDASSIGGVVKDDKNEPLIGVTIVSKSNPAVGTTTDTEGKFKIRATATDVLVFSYIGYTPKEVVVGNQTLLEVTMTADNKNLEEVIVIGYGTTTRANLTTSIAKIDPKKIPTAANAGVTDMLFGRAAGLQVNQQSSQPGGNISISIRGKGTPLIIVDGVVYPNSSLEPANGSTELQGVNRGPLAGLNPSDIESIEILKDASAAIYGIAAANGVMMITTKKGKGGRMSVSYSGSHSFVNNMPYLNPLNATDYMTYHNQLSQDKFLSDKNMVPFGNVAANLNGYTPRFTQEQVNNAGEGTDWLSQVLRKGSVNNHQLSVSGGTEKITYFFSGGYYDQKGTVKNSDLSRYSGRLNVSFQLNKFLRLNTSVSANRNFTANPQAGWQNGGSGSQGFNALQAALAYPSSVPIRGANGAYSLFATTGNPVSLLDIKDRTNFSGMLTNLSLDIDIIPSLLTAKLLYGNNNEYSVRDFYIPKTVFYNQMYRARASLAEARRENQTMEATVSLNKQVGDWLKISAVTGVGQYIDRYQGFAVEAFDLEDAINTDALQTATGPKNVSSYRNQDKFRSFFARSNFDILDRYLISLTIRRDGADKFFANNKYQVFPSASIGWKLSNEAFLSSIRQLNLLKVRASYGTTGERPGTAAYGVFAGDNTAITFNNGSVLYIPYTQTRFDNPNLRWPITSTFDVGLDFGLFSDRISGSFDWYVENRTRLLSNATTPQLSPIGSSPVNGGHQRRKGFDVSLNTVNVSSKDFTWNSTVNFTHYQNNWVKRFDNEPPAQYGNVNDPVGNNILYFYTTNGILQAGQEVPAWQPAGARKPGSPIFVDSNGDGELNYLDVKSYSGIPKGIVGFGNDLRYKNFDLSVFVYGQFGAYGNDFTSLWGDPVGLLSNTQSGTDRIKDAWSTANPTGNLPGASFVEAAVALDAPIDIRLLKKDFLRARNITLGYTINSEKISKYVRSVRVFADVQNAFTISKFKGADPEVQASFTKGGPAPYPMARTISLGLKADF
jgi:TonB-linked SusC/RagA family outer membrane protein